jgi:RNA polymerase sigma factor (sigma-70 family)
MEDMGALGLVDNDGRPLPPHIDRVLARLLPRLRRQFPALQDDVALTEVMEEAGRRIAQRERRSGPIEKIHGYAWVTMRCVATSRVRRGSIRLLQKTLESEASNAQIALVPAETGSAEQIERAILLREVLDKLSPEERRVCLWKHAGFSSQEIAEFQSRSVVAVDTLFSRAKQKLRDALGIVRKDRQTSPAEGVQKRERRPLGNADTETDDGTTRPTSKRR